MSPTPHLNELGEFLKARRSELSPRAVGLADSGGQRRVAGLRREEVAQLASISTDYYTRVEQGRLPPSTPVLEAVAQALHLDDDQRRYVFDLAGKEAARPRRRARQKVQPQLRRVLDDLTATPAVVMGRRMDVIAWNPLAAALVTDFGAVPEKHRNYVRILFTDPAMRTLYADWKGVARTAVAQLRMEAAKYPDDPRLTSLVGELCVQDEDFRQWWAAHHVSTLGVGTKVLHHPVAGELSLDWDTLTASTDPDQQLVVWTAEVGSSTHDGLRILASWAADQHRTITEPTD
ncbi:helix-turn-helix transcriptional regulator [Streptomyces sp. NPDC050204]|uniref:helix-turn-helix domain-containing protein n=1 Tax=unclassified Streptomyces TaxID=2593676 RepID=UPI002DDB0220|nr:helix-turn-helix transcriptional regulator [Streptomyces sp. NBC_01768]WSC32446.1 helix-turn-helix transcriptional regulator [Streptomyces sp. NBC_01768]